MLKIKKLIRFVIDYLLHNKFSRVFFYKRKKIEIDKILLGGEGDLPGWKYSLMSNDLIRCSTRVSNGPHAKLLEDFEKKGNNIFDFDVFSNTDYYRNVEKCIDIFGEYFPGISNPRDSIELAKKFVRDFIECSDVTFKKRPLQVVKIRGCNFYQLKQGNHRAAISSRSGARYVHAFVHRWKTETTPVQFLLNLVRWEKNEHIIYQPLNFPEISSEWKTARACTDRLNLMLSFLESKNIYSGSYLDIGSYYGWFLEKFSSAGFTITGIEKDFIASLIGTIQQPILNGKVINEDAFQFLSKTKIIFDVTSCMSIVHHQLSGRENGDATKSLQLLDQHTQKVLFFEMGQESEEWFQETLKGWNPASIEKWILNCTSFTKVYKLGTDQDGIGNFHGNYGRTLFACTRE